MRLKAEAPLERRNLVLDARTVRRLKELRTETDAASDSEVVRHALRIYEQIVEDALAGKRFVIRNADGEDHHLPDVRQDAKGNSKCDTPLERRNLMLSERSAVRLDRLKTDTGAASDSEVVQQAILFYEFLVRNSLDGNKIITQDRNGNECQIMVTGCSAKKELPRPLGVLERLRAAAYTLG